jgi:hypothetical protein
MIYDSVEAAYEKIRDGIEESDADCWVQPSEAEFACDVYLLDPELNEGDEFRGTPEDREELIKLVGAYMEERASKLRITYLD